MNPRQAKKVVWVSDCYSFGLSPFTCRHGQKAKKYKLVATKSRNQERGENSEK